MTTNEVYESSINKWNKRGGQGTLSYDSTLDLFEPIKIILNKYYAKNPNNKVIVVVANSSRIDEWATKLTKGFNYYDKLGSGLLQFLTIDSIIVNKRKDIVELAIFDQIDRFLESERLKVLKKYYIKFRYMLGVTNVAYPDGDKFGLFEVCPVIDRVTKIDVVTHGIMDGIVEYNYPVEMNDNDKVYYGELNQFITDTIQLFGDFDTVLRCYHGEVQAGISADYYRTKLAEEKGWSKDIDTSNEYWRNIDRYYNPNNIYERAKSFADVLRRRQQLLSDNPSKVDAIINVLKANPNKRVLIINKRSEFARQIANSINVAIENPHLVKDVVPGNLFKVAETLKGQGIMSDIVCVEYHPDVESQPLIDSDTGDYVRVKSGASKGTVKMFGSTSLNKMAVERFKEGKHTVVSTISSIPKEASFEMDFMIITSPECNTFSQLQYRASSLKFKDNVKIINIFLKDTKEQYKLTEKQSLTTNKIIEIIDVNDVKL